MVDKGETHHISTLQALPQNHGLLSIECVVDHLQSQIVDRWGSVQEVADGTVSLRVDLVLGIGNFLPPLAAHKEERENQNRSTETCKCQTPYALVMSFVAHDVERNLV